MNSYQSNYSNEVHQLVVSVSKHYFLTKNGIMKYQKKPFDVRIENIHSSQKTHVVHYVIRDHFSGLFYAELCDSISLIPIHDFLYRAWQKKSFHSMVGIPVFLTIPKNAQSLYPNLVQFVEKLGITYIKVTSGFQGGVRDIRTWENELKWCGVDFANPFGQQKEPTIQQAQDDMPQMFKRLFESSYNGPAKKDVYLSGIHSDQKIFVPNSMEDFKKTYMDVSK